MYKLDEWRESTVAPNLGGELTTLLAVDDSKTMRKVLEITFSGEAYQTRIASNAQEAFNELAEHPVSVALIDVTLPFESGYDVCRRVKAEYPAVRVLLLSSKQNPYDPSKGVACGADDHLDKPFDTQVLLDKVKSLLNRPLAAPVTATPPAKPSAASDSRSPTAMPAGFDDESMDSQAPILIPIEDEEPILADPALEVVVPERQAPLKPAVPLSAGIEAATNAPTRLPGTIATNHRADLTMPAAAAPSSGNGGSAFTNLESRLGNLGLTEDQIISVLALSREVVEAAVWEVVPTLAEVLIKEEIRRLTQA
jgi:CheY-like chemotaxis protein